MCEGGRKREREREREERERRERGGKDFYAKKINKISENSKWNVACLLECSINTSSHDNQDIIRHHFHLTPTLILRH